MARTVLRRRKKAAGLIRDTRLLEARRVEIADVALDLFLREGFHAATTREVARRAGVSVGGLFTYFPSKEDLLVYIITREQERAEIELINALEEQVERASASAQQTEAVFIAVFETFVRAIDRIRKYILLAYQETKSLDGRARESLIEHERRIQKILGRAIEYGAAGGGFSLDDVEIKAHNIMVLGHAWAVRHWAFAGIADSVDEYIRFLKPQVLAMLKSRVRGKQVKSRERGRRRTAAGRSPWRSELDDHGQQQLEVPNFSKGDSL